MLSEIKKPPFLVVGTSNFGELSEPIRTLLEPDLLMEPKHVLTHLALKLLKIRRVQPQENICPLGLLRILVDKERPERWSQHRW